MGSIFCCGSITPFRPQRVDHEHKFTSFKTWADFPRNASPSMVENNPKEVWPYVIQIVKQVNYGPLESKRYFAPNQTVEGGDMAFIEITENDLLEANFVKVNSYKNFRCAVHNKFFEFNLYEKDPVNKHHWRVNAARPSGEIDLNH